MPPDPDSGESPARPRLAYLFSRFPVVSHTFIDNELLALEKRGWQTVVASLSPPKNDFRHRRLDELRAPVVHLAPGAWWRALQPPPGLLDDLLRKYGETLEPGKCLRHALALRSQFGQLGIGHVHVHFANRAAYTAMLLKRLSGLPYSFTPQAADFMVDLASPALLAALCREAEFVVAPCDFAAAKLAELCPHSADRIIRIYNGVDPADYAHATPAPAGGRLRLAGIGRFVRFKGFHDVIEAVAIARTHGLEAEFHLQGDGPQRAELEALAAARKVDDLVRFEGIVGIDEMRRRFSEVDAFVLACTVDERGASDMLPTVITEAMLSGLPVISCPLAGVPEQVKDGTTGLLANPDDPQSLADAMLRLAREDGLAARLGQAAREFARRTFSLEATLPPLEAKFSNSPPAASRPPPRAPGYALYDLAVTPLDADIRAEMRTLRERGLQLWLAAPAEGSPRADDPAASGLLEQAFWLPDGMAIEMEWQHGRGMRATLEAVRTDLGEAVNGEVFLELARRALWLARQWRRIDPESPVFAMDQPSLVVAWLAASLDERPVIAPDDAFILLNEKLQARIGEATTITDAASWRTLPWFLPETMRARAASRWLDDQLRNCL